MLVSNTAPSRLRTRLSRFLYNYNAPRNKGIDWVVDYQPVREIQALKLLVNTKEFIGWNICFLGHYELDTDLILYKFIKKGMCVIEAGAHIGSETVLLGALVGKEGRVYAFEPNPFMLKRLRLNIGLNDFDDRVVASAIVLGDANDAISFYVDNENEPNQGRASKYRHDAQTIEITAHQQRLDDWAHGNKIPRVDFIKIDVQGAEIDILHGATETIAMHRPLIFAEASETMQGNSKYSIEKMYRTLVSLGYAVQKVDIGGALTQLSEDTLTGGNWLAVPQR